MMNLKMSENQKRVLNSLLNKYESSKTYKGENIRNQSFSIVPEKVFPEYDDDYTDQDDVDEFNRDMRLLAEKNLVELQTKKGTAVISNIAINLEMLQSIYELLDREDITIVRTTQIKLYMEYKGIHQIIDQFCNAQIERLSNFKDAEYDIEVAKNILKLLKFILTNKQDTMEI